MKQKTKRYRSDHESICVLCPKCGKGITGWTYEKGLNEYFINHKPPNEFGNECWLEESVMTGIIERWEKKYEYVEVDI